jgi:hypothetical protein
MKLPAAETDYWSGISYAREIAGIEVRKTAFLQPRSKNKIWNNANNWGNIICKQKNKSKKCFKQLTKYPYESVEIGWRVWPSQEKGIRTLLQALEFSKLCMSNFFSLKHSSVRRFTVMLSLVAVLSD